MKKPLFTKAAIATIQCFIILFAGGHTCIAQNKQAFSKLSLMSIQKHEMICFTVSKEVNVFHYTIEASNDSLSFEVIGVLRSKGNSVFDRSYQYKLFGTPHKYYRVCKVNMNASTEYSQLMRSSIDMEKQLKGIKTEPAYHGSGIVVNTK